jgi:hypothetical protein
VTEAEYPALLLGQTPDHPWIKEFNDQIDWFRVLVLSSKVIGLKRYENSLAGELGLYARSAVTYAQVRHAVPGFVIEVRPTTWARLEQAGYTSLLQDRQQRFILFGPLSLAMEGDDEVWLGTTQSRFDWGRSEETVLKKSSDVNEQVRYCRLGSIPKPGEAGRVPRGNYAAGDEILVRYSEPGGMTRASPSASPGTNVLKEPETVTAADDEMTVAPARVNLKTVFRDPVKSGKTGGKLSSGKSCKTKKRPIAPASDDESAAEKKSRLTTKDDRPGKKAPPAGGKVKTSKPPPAVGLSKSSAPVVDLALSDSESEDDEDTC